MSNIKCMACGDEISGAAFYCDGCSGWLHRLCGIPNQDNFNCPNCGSQLSQTSL